MTGEVPGPAEDAGSGTGDERVDAVVSRLGELDELPLAEHVGRYDEIHAALQEILTDVEQA